MKNKILFVFYILFSGSVSSQITPVDLQQALTANEKVITIPDTRLAEVKKFYEKLNFRTAWIAQENRVNCLVFLNALNQSAVLGLRSKHYPVDLVTAICNKTMYLETAKDSLHAELRITDAAIRFYSDIAYGNSKPVFGYDGLAYTPGCYDVPNLLADHITKNVLPRLIDAFPASLPEILVLKNKIRMMHEIMVEADFKEVVISSDKVNRGNQPLITKLHQSNLIDKADSTLTDAQIKKGVQAAQRQFGLLADGVLRKTIIQELNVAVFVRLEQLNLSLNYYRWLYCLSQMQAVVVVNIPAAYMKVYKNARVILEMRMVLGRPSTPTPTLTSKVSEVILYPYWHVPVSIATKELLPRIKRNPSFLNAGNYQVLNRSGKIIDPYSVSWAGLSSKNFPYIIRQSTGCDNALGLLKLNFYSPFGVYLHDTPFKDAFMLNKRYFSHGCLRMENPTALGHLVLKNNSIAIDTLEQKGCLRNQAPIHVIADEKMPVIVWYNPAGIDSTGQVLFYEDVYRKFKWVKAK